MPVTYQIYGLTESQYALPMGQATLKVNFTGGYITQYGTNPATFTTDDEMVQRIIEDTHDFAIGKIKKAYL